MPLACISRTEAHLLVYSNNCFGQRSMCLEREVLLRGNCMWVETE